MTQRRSVAGRPEDQVQKLLRDMQDSIRRLEAGAVLFGQVSVAQLTLGGKVSVTVEATGGDSVEVKFENIKTHSTYLVSLP